MNPKSPNIFEQIQKAFMGDNFNILNQLNKQNTDDIPPIMRQMLPSDDTNSQTRRPSVVRAIIIRKKP
jgi:hypothetical protein